MKESFTSSKISKETRYIEQTSSQALWSVRGRYVLYGGSNEKMLVKSNIYLASR